MSVISCLILFIKGGVGVFKNPPSSGSCYEYCVQYFFKIIWGGLMLRALTSLWHGPSFIFGHGFWTNQQKKIQFWPRKQLWKSHLLEVLLLNFNCLIWYAVSCLSFLGCRHDRTWNEDPDWLWFNCPTARQTRRSPSNYFRLAVIHFDYF